MWEELDNGLEVLQGDPIKKWCEIILNASPTLAQKELERMLEMLAVYELAYEENGGDLRKFLHTHKEAIEAKKRDIAIDSSAKILSENE
ncbi:DUF2018 family protein [Helicobacter sp. T3_23-1056]